MFGIVVNPVSGGGKNAGLTRQIGEILEKRGKKFRVFETRCVADGDRAVHEAIASGCADIVCIGGDGTLSEIMGEVAGSGVRLYLAPNGTGNDFARSLGLNIKDPVAAFLAQLDGEPVNLDCGSYNGRAFANVSGSGFDVEVLRKTEELKHIYPGSKAYTKAVLAVLGSYKAIEAEVSMDGGAFEKRRCTIIEVANGQFFGGGMRVAPGAGLQDGTFDVVTVNRVPSMTIPFLLPLFKLGIHVHLPIAQVTKAKEVVLRSKGMVVNIDGRLEETDEVRYKIMPGALHMMLPKGK